MTAFEGLSIVIGVCSSVLSSAAIIVALWNARSAARQTAAAIATSEDQNFAVRLHELETLYAARLTDLTDKYDTVKTESNLYRRHVQRCEEELARLGGRHLESFRERNED